MVAKASTMLPLGTKAPDFELPDTTGNTIRLADLQNAPALLVIFTCNHCPFVKHILDGLLELIDEYEAKGVAVVAINSNDIENFPDDSPEMMAQLAQLREFSFPYLFDESQEVAHAYKAACTSDFFLFDGEQKLFYRGQMDDSRPGNGIPVTGADLRNAIDALLSCDKSPDNQKPSMGCNIKWKSGNEPEYF